MSREVIENCHYTNIAYLQKGVKGNHVQNIERENWKNNR